MRKTFSVQLLLRSIGLTATVFAVMALVPSMARAQKMTAEEVVAKHLESIGPAAARANAKGRAAVGNTRATFRARNNSGSIDGRAVVGSMDHKIVYALVFNAPNYPGEKFGFDGKKLTIGYIIPGVRSSLGSFVLINSDVFKEGLMGGTLSSAWSLLDVAGRGSKLEYAGTEKIGERSVHKLDYSPKKGSDLNITLYFDATTFEHVRTQYRRVISSRMGTGGIDNQARQMETRYRMVEDFSDYKKAGELNLPHSYTLNFEIIKTNGSSNDKWETEFTQFLFDQELDEAGFNVENP